jgi:hypothetical protein
VEYRGIGVSDTYPIPVRHFGEVSVQHSPSPWLPVSNHESREDREPSDARRAAWAGADDLQEPYIQKATLLRFLLVGGSLNREQTTLGQPLRGGRGARRHGSTHVQSPEPRPPWDRQREHSLVVTATDHRVLKTPTQPRTRHLNSPRAGVLC